MAFKGIIVYRNEGQEVPRDYLEKAIAECDTSVGFALVEDDKVNYSALNGKPDLDGDDGLCEIMKAWKERIVFFFGKGDAAYDEDDLQPFILLEDEEGRPLLAAFVEGEFTNFTKQDSHSPGYHFASTFLLEKITDLYQLHAEDLEKMMGAVDTATTRKTFQDAIVGKFTIVLVAADGAILAIQKDGNMKTYPWGWTTDALGYGVEAPAKVERSGPATWAEKVAAKKAAAAAAPANVTVSKEPVIAKATVPTVSQATQPAKTEAAHVIGAKVDDLLYPPKDNHGKELRKWYARNFVVTPENVNNRPGMPASQLREGSALRARIKELNDEKLRTVATAAPTTGTEVPLILMPGQKKEIMEKFLPTIALLDAEKIKATETETPTFFEQTDYPLADFIKWPVAKRRQFCAQWPHAASIIMSDLVYELIEAKPELLKTEKKADVVVEKGNVPMSWKERQEAKRAKAM